MAKRKNYGIKDIEDYSSLGNLGDAWDSVWGSGRKKWKRFPAHISEEDYQDRREDNYRERSNQPIHVINEDYDHYQKRKSSGNGILMIFGGFGLSAIGLIFLYKSIGIVDRLLFALLILLGFWIAWKGFKRTARGR